MTTELKQIEAEILPMKYLTKKPQPEDDPVEIDWIPNCSTEQNEEPA